MAKFVSPYKLAERKPPKDDEKYNKYLKDLQLDTSDIRKKYGFALFGIGRAGTIHLSFLISKTNINLLYIVDDDKSKWEKLKNYWNLNSVKFLTSTEACQVYNDSNVRAVVVASPTYTHEKIVINALCNGKAVFCEKPIAETIEKTQICYETAKKMNQPLFCAFNRRFDLAFSSVKNRVTNGEIGEILTIKVCSRDSPLPSIDYLKISGGIFHDCAVHDIDMISFICGEYPTKVSVIAKANIPEIAAIQDFDNVGILLSFNSGTIGIIDLCRHSTFGYDQRLEVFGVKGMIKAENRLAIENVEIFRENFVEKSPISYSFASRYAEAYQREMEHFLNVLEGNEELCVTANDTLAVTRIASACEEAAKTGKAVEIKWT